MVGTPHHRKYENKDTSSGYVVAAEVDLINNRLLGTEPQKQSVLPLLLNGEKTDSLPPRSCTAACTPTSATSRVLRHRLRSDPEPLPAPAEPSRRGRPARVATWAGNEVRQLVPGNQSSGNSSGRDRHDRDRHLGPIPGPSQRPLDKITRCDFSSQERRSSFSLNHFSRSFKSSAVLSVGTKPMKSPVK